VRRLVRRLTFERNHRFTSAKDHQRSNAAVAPNRGVKRRVSYAVSGSIWVRRATLGPGLRVEQVAVEQRRGETGPEMAVVDDRHHFTAGVAGEPVGCVVGGGEECTWLQNEDRIEATMSGLTTETTAAAGSTSATPSGWAFRRTLAAGGRHRLHLRWAVQQGRGTREGIDPARSSRADPVTGGGSSR